MWVRDIRAVAFSDIGTLRRSPPSDVLAGAVFDRLAGGGVALSRSGFIDGWTEAVRLRNESRWTDLSEQRLEDMVGAILPGPPDDLADVVSRAVDSIATTIEWFPDALPTLDFLRESDYRIVLVSDSPGPLGPTWQARMAPWLDAAILSRDVGRVKPHPAMFKEVLARLGLLPKQVLLVGDQIVADVFGAKGLRLRTVLLERVPREPPPAESIEWLKRVHSLDPKDVVPDLKVRSLEELPAVVEHFG